jgi:nicotinamide riboside transporter PnuC
MHMNVYNAAGQLLYNSSTTSSNLTFNLRNLAADTYFVWIAPRYPATSTVDVRLHPMVGSTVTTDGTPTNFSTTAFGQIGYFEFAATAGQSMSVAIQNVALTPNVAGSYYLYVYAPNGAQVGFVNCYTGWGVCDVVHMRNLAQSGTYRMELHTPATQTMSGTLTVSQNVTGTLSPSVPMSLNLSTVGQGAHLTFTATAGQTFALALSSLSTTPANSPMHMNVYNAAGQLLYNSSTTSSNLTFNLRNLAADTYFVWIAPRYPVTSTVDVTLHPGVGGTVTPDGTPVSFSTPALGQIAYYQFAATAGDEVSISLTGVVASPASPAAQYYASVFAPNGTNLGWIGCWSTWTVCDVLHLRNLAQTGTYRVEVSTYATHTISGSLTATLGQTGSLSPNVPLDLTLGAVGQSAELSFTATANQTVSLHMGPLSTVPANTRMYVYVYNAAGTYLGSSMNSTVGASLVLRNLPAGTYYAWVLPQYPATSTVQMTMRPAVAVPTDGTSTSFNTTALGQSRSFTFSGTAGGNVSIALDDIVASPGTSPVQYWFAVFQPDGQNVWTNSCWSNWTACDVMHLRNLAQTGTYRIDISVAATDTLSGTLTLTQALTGTLASGVPVNVTLPLLGQTMLFDMTLSSAQPVSVTGTSISTTPAGRPMQVYIFNPSGSLIASNSSTTGVTVNMGTLQAGSYKVWVVPQYPSTSSLVVGY